MKTQPSFCVGLTHGVVSHSPPPPSRSSGGCKKRSGRGIFILGPSVGRPGRLTAYMGGVCGKGPLMTGGCAGAGSGAGIRL
jgi:hypothetical protein